MHMAGYFHDMKDQSRDYTSLESTGQPHQEVTYVDDNERSMNFLLAHRVQLCLCMLLSRYMLLLVAFL